MYFGTNGKPLNQKHGYAKVTDRYDGYGAFVEEAYFGASGKPVLNDNGIARITEANDEFGRAAEWAYFGVRGEPVIGRKDHRYHRAKQVLDERSNQLEFATFGIDGKALDVADPASGRLCARLVRRFDATNKEIGSECFDAAGKLTFRKSSSKGSPPWGFCSPVAKVTIDTEREISGLACGEAEPISARAAAVPTVATRTYLRAVARG